jgi:hypothetical protein
LCRNFTYQFLVNNSFAILSFRKLALHIKTPELLALGVIVTLLLLQIWPEIIFVTFSIILLVPLKILIDLTYLSTTDGIIKDNNSEL